jgi:glutamyl-tRNA synthetase
MMKSTKNWKAETPALMQLSVVEEITDFTSMNIETYRKRLDDENEIGMGK